MVKMEKVECVIDTSGSGNIVMSRCTAVSKMNAALQEGYRIARLGEFTRAFRNDDSLRRNIDKNESVLVSLEGSEELFPKSMSPTVKRHAAVSFHEIFTDGRMPNVDKDYFLGLPDSRKAFVYNGLGSVGACRYDSDDGKGLVIYPNALLYVSVMIACVRDRKADADDKNSNVARSMRD